MTVNKLKLLCYSLILIVYTNFPINAQLKDSANQCDYLIIAPSQFVNPLQTFINWREQKDLDVKLVELQKIYSEFPDSNQSSSIRDFVSYALTYWSDPKPKYLLLVGGIKLLPSHRVISQFAKFPDIVEDSVSIDEWYSVNKYESDTKPDIALGRFPVNNEEELNNIVAKTINFEDSLSFEDYPTDFTFLTDKTDSSLFEYVANNFINRYLPANFSKQTIFAGQDSTITITRNNLLNGLSNGTLFLSYYGHGAPYKWSKYDIFNIDDIDSLKSNSLPFIYTSAACSQSFDLPDDSSLVRKLIIHPKGGTVSSIAATGLNYITAGTDFLSIFYSNIFDNPHITVGEAVLKTKQSFYSANAIDNISQRYTLLGDPALKIPVYIIAQVVSKPKEIQDTYSLKQNYPNPFNPTTTIQYDIRIASNVKIEIFDVLGRRLDVLLDKLQNPGSYKLTFDGSKLSSGIYFYKLTAGNFQQTRKMILIK